MRCCHSALVVVRPVAERVDTVVEELAVVHARYDASIRASG